MSDHDAIIVRLDDLKELVSEQIALARETNGRLRKAEANVAVLNRVVFGGGALLIGALGYLIQMHLAK